MVIYMIIRVIYYKTYNIQFYIIYTMYEYICPHHSLEGTWSKHRILSFLDSAHQMQAPAHME